MADVYTPEILPSFATLNDVSAQTRSLLASSDADLEAALDEATAHIRDLCGWHIAPQLRHTVQVEASWGLAFLPTLRIVEIHSVQHAGSPVSPGTVFPSGRIVVPNYDAVPLDVELTHGHDAVPLALRRLAVLMALRAEASRLGITREQVGPQAVSFTLTGAQAAGGMVVLDSEQPTLTPYMRGPLP